jgi:hypothetical protein
VRRATLARLDQWDQQVYRDLQGPSALRGRKVWQVRLAPWALPGPRAVWELSVPPDRLERGDRPARPDPQGHRVQPAQRVRQEPEALQVHKERQDQRGPVAQRDPKELPVPLAQRVRKG